MASDRRGDVVVEVKVEIYLESPEEYADDIIINFLRRWYRRVVDAQSTRQISSCSNFLIELKGQAQNSICARSPTSLNWRLLLFIVGAHIYTNFSWTLGPEYTYLPTWRL
jgi:hypothetical protein